MKKLLLALAVALPLLPLATSSTAGAADQPSNGRIWFTRADGAQNHVYSMNPDGSDKELKFGRDFNIFDLSFSPGGGYLAFTSNHDVYVRRVGTTTTTRITGAQDNYEPVFSPDGQKIAWARDDSGLTVWVMNRDGSGKHQVSVGPRDAFAPQWSHTGKYLYWTQHETNNSTSLVRAYSTDGSHKTTLVTTSSAGRIVIAGPVRSDGERMLYVSDNSGMSQLFSMDPDGSDKSLKVGGEFEVGYGGSLHADPQGFGYSPDGTKMYWAQQSASGHTQIWTADSDGSHKKQLTFSDVNNSSPAWRND